MKSSIILVLIVLSAIFPIDAFAQDEGWELIWQDEFEADGRPDSTKWTYELGFERNEELQWYTQENAFQRDGHLVIEARPADLPCPSYKEGSTHWRNNRPRILWTSSSVKTRGLFSFLYGRVEVRARIPVNLGAWPAIWLLGDRGGWPACGEIDMMEYYQYKGQPTVLANACWAGDKDTQWDSSYTPLTHFTEGDSTWAERFHVWRMDWDENAIRLFLDDELLNEIDLSLTVNGKLRGTGINPFHHPQYLLLNLALDTRVRQYNPADFPMRYEIDYVRVYRHLSLSHNAAQIASIEPVCVETPVGYAPRLPYQLWVTDADGRGEYRQVKWMNASEATEQAEANPTINPVGTTYKVRGFILGDNQTLNGYPVWAEVKVVDSIHNSQFIIHNTAIPKAEPLPLDAVSIDGDNRLTRNRDLDIEHLLTLSVKQQLYNYRDTYGLPTDGYPESDGWDSPTTKLKGHGSGHYMSALAFAFASCQDKTKKDILRHNITEMVDGLRECQERTFVWKDELGRYWEARDFAPEEELKTMQGTWADFDRYKQEYEKYGYGYLNAIPAQHCVLIEMYRAYNNDNWVWAPYYSVHKQLAGLIDIATYIDDKTVAEKALLIAKDMGLWVWNRLHYRTYVKSDGRQDERRARPGNRYEMWNMYIAGEVGGMAESLARLSEMTGTAEEKAHLLEAANFFDSPAFFDPLSKNIDAIRTRHANQHIPMVTGALRSYRGNHNPYYYDLAENFWTMIQGRYRYAMGGVGNGEMFRQPYAQMTSMLPEPNLNETCCAYNLAKLTKDLNCFNPDDARYMDYYERVLYNQIVGSVNPRKYQTCYQYAVGLDASKPWGNETPQSSCCGGTGAENHVKYQEAAYFVSPHGETEEGAPTLWVALYMPTTAYWKELGVTIKQECEWPAEHSTIRIIPDSQLTINNEQLTIRLRVPYWATEGFAVKLNGRSIATHYQPSSYVEIPARKWSEKDVVEVIMPFTRHIDYGPDKVDGYWLGAFMHGPLVMAATDVKTWDEATVDLNTSLNLIPDYDGDQHLTHYFRLRDDSLSMHNSKSKNQNHTDASFLRELLRIAGSRVDEQEAWEALAVKVPEYAPWAKHGYTRMKEQMKEVQPIADSPENKYSQEEIDKAADALNAIINTMRPGNLAEPEDLEELQSLLEKANKQFTIHNSQSIIGDKASSAISYANMVIRYVTDGSGTKDMIERATNQIKEILKQKKTHEKTE